MPAFKTEGFVSTHQNYLFAVDFELASTKFPNSPIKSFIGDWQKIGRELNENPKIGGMLKKGKLKAIKSETENLIAAETDPMAKIASIQHYVKSKILWDGYHSPMVSQSSLSKILEKGKGNSGDINILMIAMLKIAGFNAQPVMLSTRQNGFLNPYFPSFQQFNHVLAGITMEDGTIVLLDATDKAIPAGMLPSKCINDKGLMIREATSNWISLNPTGKYRVVRQYNLNLNDNLEWTGDLTVKCKDYAARSMRYSYGKHTDEKEYLQSLENEHSGLTIQNASFENLADIYKQTVEKYEVTFADQIIDAGDLLYFNPILTFGETENPFKLAERKYPVDFNYPISYVYSANFEIPEGYAVEEVPEDLIMSLPNKGGKFIYNIKIIENKINLTHQFQLNKHLYLPEEYGGLKEFYNLVVEKHGTQIVLKKQ